MSRQDMYVSVDIEADGPAPGLNSMLSLGAAAFRRGERDPWATYEVNFELLPQATADDDTMRWWSEQDPAVWAHVRKNPMDVIAAMTQFKTWVEALPGNPVLVVFPTWDAMWINWYFSYSKLKNPFGIGALDIKSAAFATGRFKSFKEVTKRNMPKAWFRGSPPHTHKALEDAIGQGVLFINAMTQV